MQKLNLPDRLHMRPARVSDKIFIETLYKATRDENYSYSEGYLTSMLIVAFLSFHLVQLRIPGLFVLI
jgi:hypothetical protein